ncbi:MAG: ion channel [Bradymonadaceae bacterium]
MSEWVRSLWWFAIGLVVFLVICAALPVAEQAAADPNIENFSDAIWYGVVTLTTVGYGDYFPKSLLGRLLGAVFVLGSLGMLGLLIGEIGEAIAAYRERQRLGHHGFEGSGHLFVVGWHGLIEDVVEQLREFERPIVVVTDEKADVDQIHERYGDEEVFPLYAGYSDMETLAHGKPAEAFRIYVGLRDDTETLVTLLNLQREFPDQDFVVSVEKDRLRRTFRGAGVNHAVSTDRVTAGIVASLIFEPDVAEFTRDLITADTTDSEGYDIQQYWIADGHDLVGRDYGEAFEELVREHEVVPVGLRKDDESHVRPLPDDDVGIEAGDYLLVVTPERREPFLEEEYFGVTHGLRVDD